MRHNLLVRLVIVCSVEDVILAILTVVVSQFISNEGFGQLRGRRQYVLHEQGVVVQGVPKHIEIVVGALGTSLVVNVSSRGRWH